jgi:dihydrofolate reductase
VPRVRCHISMSLDGFVAGPNQSPDNPIGEGGMALHEWVFGLAAWRQGHGLEGGEVNASTPVVEAVQANIGATVMGRNMFGGGPGRWADEPWDGWWGDDPPFHHAVFVLTNHARETLVKDGGNSFVFVTDGIESALARARAAAGEQDVAVAGGASVARQYLKAGLLDELVLHVVPVLLGAGERLFDDVAGADLDLECTEAVHAPGVTHLTYRVGKAGTST